MAVNLREFALIYRPYAAGFRTSVPEIPEFRRPIWCSIVRGIGAERASRVTDVVVSLKVILLVRWNDLHGVEVASSNREYFYIVFGDDVTKRQRITDIRPATNTDPRTFAEVEIASDFDDGLPFTYLPPEATTETVPDD